MESITMLKITMIALCTLIATFAGCSGIINHQDNIAMLEMVKKGADPQDARCAIKGSNGMSECAIRAATKNR